MYYSCRRQTCSSNQYAEQYTLLLHTSQLPSSRNLYAQLGTSWKGIDWHFGEDRYNTCPGTHSCTVWWRNCQTYRREKCNKNRLSLAYTANDHNPRAETDSTPSPHVCTERSDTNCYRCGGDRCNTSPSRRCGKHPEDNCHWCLHETCNTPHPPLCCTDSDCSPPSGLGNNRPAQQHTPPQDTCWHYDENQCSACLYPRCCMLQSDRCQSCRRETCNIDQLEHLCIQTSRNLQTPIGKIL